MTTGEGPTPGEGQPRPEAESPRRGDRISVGAPDESVSRIQLAARWAEAYTADGESLATILRRFRVAYEYLDAVTHGVEPPDMDSTAEQAKPAVPPPGAEVAPPAWGNPEPAPPAPAPAPAPPPPSPPPWSNP